MKEQNLYDKRSPVGILFEGRQGFVRIASIQAMEDKVQCGISVQMGAKPQSSSTLVSTN
jgi:hypothetical protein